MSAIRVELVPVPFGHEGPKGGESLRRRHDATLAGLG